MKPLVIILDRSVTHPGEKYVHIYSGLGAIQLLIGTMMVILCVATMAIAGTYFDYAYGLTNVAPGIWCGALTIATGLLGIQASKEGKNIYVVASLVVCILTALSAAAMTLIESFAIYVVWEVSGVDPQPSSYGMLVIHFILCCLAIFELVVSIVQSAICCKVKCCQPPQSQLPADAFLSQTIDTLKHMPGGHPPISLSPTEKYPEPEFGGYRYKGEI